MAKVPDLSGIGRADATSALRKANLTLGNVSYYDTTNEEEAVVYYQSVAAGGELPAGTSIDVSLRKK